MVTAGYHERTIEWHVIDTGGMRPLSGKITKAGARAAGVLAAGVLVAGILVTGALLVSPPSGGTARQRRRGAVRQGRRPESTAGRPRRGGVPPRSPASPWVGREESASATTGGRKWSHGDRSDQALSVRGVLLDADPLRRCRRRRDGAGHGRRRENLAGAQKKPESTFP